MDPTTTGRFRVLDGPGTDDGDRPGPDELLLLSLDDEEYEPVAVELAGGDASVSGTTSADSETSTGGTTSAGGKATADGEATADSEATADGSAVETGFRTSADENPDGAGGGPADPADLEPGNVVEATLVWTDGVARFDDVELRSRTRFRYAAGVTGIFEAAKDTWRVAEAEGEAMNARVTRDTDGEPNGALYVFAEQPGARDLYEEFRTGARPLDPLVRRVEEGRSDEAAAEAEESDADAIEPDAGYEVFVLRPADEPFVVVYIAFERDGLLARTVRETYFSDSD